MKQLSYTSGVGSFFVVAAMIVKVVYGFVYQMEHLRAFEPALVNANYFSAFGSVAFLYCIHVLVLPIERAMFRHDKFPLTLSTAFTIMAVFNTVACWATCSGATGSRPASS